MGALETQEILAWFEKYPPVAPDGAFHRDRALEAVVVLERAQLGVVGSERVETDDETDLTVMATAADDRDVAELLDGELGDTDSGDVARDPRPLVLLRVFQVVWVIGAHRQPRL